MKVVKNKMRSQILKNASRTLRQAFSPPKGMYPRDIVAHNGPINLDVANKAISKTNKGLSQPVRSRSKKRIAKRAKVALRAFKKM